MNEEDTKLLEGVRQHLEATGWKRDKDPLNNEIWFVRREGAPECQSNKGGGGILVIVTVHWFGGRIFFSIDIIGQKENGVWNKLQSYAIGREFLDVFDVEVSRLVEAWRVMNGTPTPIAPTVSPVVSVVLEPVLTPEQQRVIDQINAMSHFDMCKLWRHAPVGHAYLDSTTPYAEVFQKRLFEHFGGFTPEISKAVGWETSNAPQ